jgi:lipopolysaccharide transport system ATP-binding protein
MSGIAIQAERLGKLYHIGRVKPGDTRLGDRLLDLAVAPFQRAARLLGGAATAASGLDQRLWALRDLSFGVQQGDVVGVIGHNGAGKSTLLKILTRITEPTEGYADVYGRVGALLEVGTGFHPELTGRQNVFLNGAILGMRKAEIERKLDAIVSFAEIEKFVDTPVKHYSSGMYVRLAFSVAAHLEPEILLVDEVLAVGDVSFQKKCIGRIDGIAREGRTVVFVSHNMNAVQRLCSKCMLLEHGRLVAFGETPAIVRRYLETGAMAHRPGDWIDLAGASREGSRKVHFAAFSYSSLDPATANRPYPHGPLEISVDLVSDAPRSIGSVAVTLRDRYGTKLVNADSLALGQTIALSPGHNTLCIRIDELYLNPGAYVLGLWAADPPAEVHDRIDSAAVIEVVERESERIRVEGDGLVPCRFRVEQARDQRRGLP